MLTFFKSSIGLVLLVMQTKAEQCTTPNNEKAECTSLYSCPVLLKALKENKNGSVEFVAKSNTCGGTTTNPLVCCGSTSTFQEFDKTANDLLPDKKICGLQHSDDYVRPTNETSINEFPWVARIRYRDAQNRTIKTKYKCSASLINDRYVLTAASCLVNINKIVDSVRLGEYHSKNETDCVIEDELFTECSEPVEDIEIEELIPHPGYDDWRIINDIGLIRLKKKVQYSDYIRPICLPIPGTKLLEVGDLLVRSGWGGMYENDNGEVSIKKKVFTKLITNEECTAAYNLSRFTATESHLCTRILSNNTDLDCWGDKGGPVMTSRRIHWYQEAILSHRSSKRCSSVWDRLPQILTNVAHYVDWIVTNMRP